MKRRTLAAAVLAALPTFALPATATAAAAGTAPVPRPTAVVLVDFTDKRHPDKAAAVAKAQSVFFGSGLSVATYFAASSGGRTTLAPAPGKAGVFGPWLLDMPAGCDTGKIRTLGEAKMKANGLDPKAFKHVSFIMPSGGCGWAGLASVGGPTSWMPDGYSVAGTVHEIGHNFGLSHEPTQACPAGTLSNCADAGYRGKSSVMGGGGPQVGLSAPALVKLGWHTAAERVVPQSSGTYTLTPLYGQNRRFLDIPLSNGDRLVAECRRRGFGPDVDVAEGVILYLVRSGAYQKAIQVDTTPETTEKGSTPLGVGKTIKDLGITLKLVSQTAAAAQVQLTMNGAPAPSPAPTPTPVPTSTAGPTSTPAPTSTAAPTSTPVPTSTPAPVPTPSPSSSSTARPTTGPTAGPAGTRLQVAPNPARPGGVVTVTAGCADGGVRWVTSRAFTHRTIKPARTTGTWTQRTTISAKARSGAYRVWLVCGDHTVRRATITVRR
ncbi:hypothetical protein HII36_49405 [Nonomuraea sp. NN258]|uniref:hypothetical protein n=1 Tax=Nonomuraea antri TaxID=2730852 RepID=UPI001568B962|nr:hypothetical protein [Nonomuraea antri]NRQ39795.1 hypothetical protein [Nonomuraea antri]